MPAPGGVAANVAIVAARAGAAITVAGGAGDDAWGRWLRAALAAAGVDTPLFALIPGMPTQLAFVTVDDPETFNEKLHMVQRWRKVDNPLLETVCAENNGDHFDQGLFPIPEAKKPDF